MKTAAVCGRFRTLDSAAMDCAEWPDVAELLGIAGNPCLDGNAGLINRDFDDI